MPEPVTPNINLIVPNTGDLVGIWGSAAVNPNFVAIDGTLGGVQVISLTSSSFNLTAPGSISPSAGPTQSQNALIRFTGTLASNVSIGITMPGLYVFENRCTVGPYAVQLTSVFGGNSIGLPPGRKTTVFYDGVDVDFANPADPGTAYDLHGATTYPAWMSACSVLPYLLKDGSIYNVSDYPALGARLGSQFGGNGVTTFGVPDELARARIAFDTHGTGRLTTAGNGTVNGTTMGSAGGDQLLMAHNHAASASVTDPSHTHGGVVSSSGGQNVGSAAPPGVNTNGSTAPATTGISVGITVLGNGGGSSQNVQPSIISFLPLVKT